MDHEQATTLITDRARGKLDSGLSADLDSHLRGCVECQGALEASAALEAQIRSRGPEYLSPHPPAEDVAAYAVFPARLPTARLAAVALHVRACPICEVEASTARRSLSGAWWRGFKASTLGAEPLPARALLAPALAVLALALLYPAYLGTVRYPAALRERDQATVAVDSLRGIHETVRPKSAPSIAPSAGGVASLVLAGPSRESRPAVPVIRLHADQPYLHVVIDHPSAAEARAARRPLEITIMRVGETTPIWRVEGNAASLWDEGLQAAGVVVPADRLPPGTYRLELRVDPGDPDFTAEFRVQQAVP